MTTRTYLGIPRDRISWRPYIDEDNCVGCGECMETCPNGVYVLNEEAGKVEVVEPDNCVVLCDKCGGFCPQGAISFPDKAQMKKRVAELLREQGALPVF